MLFILLDGKKGCVDIFILIRTTCAVLRPVISNKLLVFLSGTADNDTVCHTCPNGTYSDTASALQNCREHKSCDAAGLHLVLKGSAWHDSLCTTCQELRSKGKITSF